jgi:hypothetical protein
VVVEGEAGGRDLSSPFLGQKKGRERDRGRLSRQCLYPYFQGVAEEMKGLFLHDMKRTIEISHIITPGVKGAAPGIWFFSFWQ